MLNDDVGDDEHGNDNDNDNDGGNGGDHCIARHFAY